MSRFLSTVWFDEVRRAQPQQSGPPALTLQQVVTGTPDGEVRYSVLVGQGGSWIESGAADSPDMTFTSDWETATAIAHGDLSVQAALSTGRIRVGGDTASLGRNQSLLAGIDPLPPVVRDATTWNDETDGRGWGGHDD